MSVPAWQDGSTVDSNGNPIYSRVGFKGHAPNWSLYFADTLTLWKTVNVTLSGRYNYDTVNNLDLLNPIAGPGSPGNCWAPGAAGYSGRSSKALESGTGLAGKVLQPRSSAGFPAQGFLE